MPSDREITKQINQMTRESPYYEKFNERRYSHPKGYVEYENVVFNLARLLMSYQIYDGSLFETDFTHKTSVIILNQAYQKGFGSYWLGEQLFEAFCKSHLPKTLLEIKRIIPSGILLFPPRLKNPDGQYLKWICFYHRLADEKILPIQLLKANIYVEPNPEDCLSWFTMLDDGTQYGVTRHLKIENNHLEYKTDDVYINEYIQEKGKNIDTATEKDFSNQVTELLIQTLLYLQLKGGQLVEAQSANSPKKNISKKQKIAPFIIGQDYRVKSEPNYISSDLQRKSPMTHWRRGFYRLQPYGSKTETKHKLIWIEPILVNE
jgi:hypothetical protein